MTEPPRFSLHYLADVPQHRETLARWHYAQWGHWNPANDVAARCDRLRNHLRKDGVPLTFVATTGEPAADSVALGSAALVVHDLPGREDLSPWLASVYVDRAWRGRGVGRALVRRVMDEAKKQGLPRLYLFTPDKQAFYEHLGWTVLERRTHHGDAIVVMEYAP